MMRKLTADPRAASPSGRVGTARRAAAFFLFGALGLALPSGLAQAQSAPSQYSAAAIRVQSYDAHIAEAAQRFGLPPTWIAAVMQVESAGRPQAVSSAGAMGLMQIMPDTWAGLRRRHGLGDDPFYPRDNILGGTAYLREMYDRFGAPGFLAAYNAGPRRYEQHLAGRPLPAETRAYVAMLAPVIDGTAARPTRNRADADWRTASLFAGASAATDMQSGRRHDAETVQSERETPAGIPAPDHSAHAPAAASAPSGSNPLFVPHSGAGGGS